MKPDILLFSMLGCVAGAMNAAPFSDWNVSYGGFVSQGYLQTDEWNFMGDSEDGSFEFTEFALNASVAPLPKTTINGQVFAFDLGQFGNLDPQLDYLFVDYQASSRLGISAGRIRRPGGFYNDIIDVDAARTTIFAPIVIYDPRYRDMNTTVDGMSLYGSFDLGGAGFLDYQAFIGQLSLDLDSGPAALATTQASMEMPSETVELDSDYAAGFQLWYTPYTAPYRFGYSLVYVPDLTMESRIFAPGLPVETPIMASNRITARVHTLSAEAYWGKWTFQSEWYLEATSTYTRLTVPQFTVVDGQPEVSYAHGPSTKAPRTHSFAYYLSASYQATPKLAVGLMYGARHRDIDDLQGREMILPDAGYQKDLALSVRYNVRDWWILKGEVHAFDGVGLLFNERGQNPALGVDSFGRSQWNGEDKWMLFALKSTFVF